MAVLVDTGVFVSAADADEPRHHQCAQLLDEHRGELVVARDRLDAFELIP